MSFQSVTSFALKKADFGSLKAQRSLFEHSWVTTDEVRDHCANGDCYTIHIVQGIQLMFLGFICMSFEELKNGQVRLHIYFLEFIEQMRDQKLFKPFLTYLFGLKYKGKLVRSLEGESIAESLYIWDSVGADFGLSDERLQEYYDEAYSAVFLLTRDSFQKATRIILDNRTK